MIASALMYFAVAVFFIGVGRKVIQYAITPAPLKIPVTPAPTTRSGVIWRLIREVVCFESLFKASKFTWLFGWLFHAGLFVALLWHLRLFTQSTWWWVALLAPLGRLAGFAMVIGLSGLLLRRIFVDRVRAISAPSDYLMLVLILIIAATGLLMRFIAPADIGAAVQFARGLLRFDFFSLSGTSVLVLHVVPVAILLLIFPFSKLLHAPGLFFSPSRNQVDNSREKRHVSRITPKNVEPERTGGTGG